MNTNIFRVTQICSGRYFRDRQHCHHGYGHRGPAQVTLPRQSAVTGDEKKYFASPKIISNSPKIFAELRLAERSERAGCGGGAGGRGAAQHAAGGRQDQREDWLGGHQVSGHNITIH